VTKQKTDLGNVPSLIYYHDLSRAVIKGTVLLFHGFWGCKENHEDLLVRLAEEGFVAVGVDNKNHGSRRPEAFEALYSAENPEVETNFLLAVLGTAKELPGIIDELLAKGWARQESIGVAGISMGGYITYRAITEDPRIRTAVSIIGSPRFKLDWEESPHNHIDRFDQVYLLSQNVTRDEVVPTSYAREFHQEPKDHYSDYEKRFRYLEYPESTHMMNAQEWKASIEELVTWFLAHL